MKWKEHAMRISEGKAFQIELTAITDVCQEHLGIVRNLVWLEKSERGRKWKFKSEIEMWNRLCKAF